MKHEILCFYLRTASYVFMCYVQNGWSPMLLAAERGHTEIVRLLLQNNARVDVFDEVRDMFD